MIRYDFHTHTTLSTDGLSPMEEMIMAASRGNLKGICFTEHMDYDNTFTDEGENAFIVDIPSYRALYESLKVPAEKEGVRIYFGIELGLQPHLKDFYRDLTSRQPFDFCIGSSHLCRRMDVALPAYYESFSSEEEAHREYFACELECARIFDEYDVYGHLDYALRYGPTRDSSFTYEKYSDLLDELLLTIIGRGKGIELNTAGIRKGMAGPNPAVSIIKRYKKLGGDIITVGSDAHRVQDVAADFSKAEEILKDSGFTHYTVFEGRRPRFLKL